MIDTFAGWGGALGVGRVMPGRKSKEDSKNGATYWEMARSPWQMPDSMQIRLLLLLLDLLLLLFYNAHRFQVSV